jgi:hypothetical protein
LWGDYLTWFVNEKRKNNHAPQVEILRLWFSMLNATDPDRYNKFHIIQAGPAEVTKWFTLKVCQWMSIPGTVILSDSAPSSNKTACGNHDYAITISDVLPTERTSHQSLDATPVVIASTKDIDTLDTKQASPGRHEAKHVTFTNQVNICHTNQSIDELAPIMTRRCFVTNVKPVPAPCQTEVLTLTHVPQDDRPWLRFQESTRLFQSLTAYVNMLINAGELPPVRTPWSELVFPKILDLGCKLGWIDQHRHHKRSFQRFLAAVRAAVIQRALLVVFCSELSSFRDQEFEAHHLNALIPELVDHDPSVPLSVFGIMSEQYSPDISQMRTITQYTLQELQVAPGQYVFNINQTRHQTGFETIHIVNGEEWAKIRPDFACMHAGDNQK